MDKSLKIPYSKISIWGFLFFISLTIMFLFFGKPIYQKIMGGVFLLFAIMSLNYHFGIELRKDSRIRDYHSIFNYSFGKWKQLPPIKHIVVLRVKQYKWDMRFGALGPLQRPSNNVIFQLNLIFQNNNKQKMLSTTKSKAEKIAFDLGKLLNVEFKIIG